MEKEQQFITLNQAANLAGLSEVSIRRAVRRGELQFFRASSYRLHLDKAELEKWIAKRSAMQPVK
jgi:excisionase family DNA binding protein